MLHSRSLNLVRLATCVVRQPSQVLQPGNNKLVMVKRCLATKVTEGTTQAPSVRTDPDPNTPITKMLDRLADVAFMTELFRGVSFVFKNSICVSIPLKRKQASQLYL
jgi:hypothetical protein